MDWKTFVVEIIKAIAWPVAVLAGLYGTRELVGRLLEGLRLHRFKAGQFEAEFTDKLQQVEKAVAELRPVLGTNMPALPPHEPVHGEPVKAEPRLIRLPETDALFQTWEQETILREWQHLEGFVRQLAGTGNPNESFSEVLDGMVKEGKFKQQSAIALLAVQHLRDLAAIAPVGADLRVGDFVRLTKSLHWAIEREAAAASGKVNP